MGVEKFELPVGAAGDVAELEYISALHQSGEEEKNQQTGVRADASIKASDIRLYLSSRFGIKVTNKQVKERILHGLGSARNEMGDTTERTADDPGNNVFDIVEIAACLLIPTFLKAEQLRTGNPLPHFILGVNATLLGKTLGVILHDVTGSTKPKTITPDLIRQILLAYGEHELADDRALLEEMVEVCGDFSKLDEDALSQALTSDIKLFNLENEGSLSTNLADVFHDEFDGIGVPLEDEEGVKNLSIPLQRKKTLSQIDVTAGTFRSKTLIILLWCTFAISYFSFSFEVLNTGLERVCTGTFEYDYSAPWAANGGSLVCISVVSIMRWLFYFIGMARESKQPHSLFRLYLTLLSLAVLGLGYITLGSTGNSVYCKDWRMPLAGATAVLLPIVILYAKLQGTAGVFLSRASLALALVTACYHVCHAAYLGWPAFRDFAGDKHSFLASSVYDEMRLKVSAAHKIGEMVENALSVLEEAKTGSYSSEKYYSKGLQAYTKMGGRRTEEAGGLVWAWKRILGLDKSFVKEGIWMSARLVASNIAQFVVAIYILVFGAREFERLSSESYVKGTASDKVQELILRAFDSAPGINLSEVTVGNVTSLIREFFSLQVSGSGIDVGCDGFASTAEDILAQYCMTDPTDSPFDLVCDQSASVNYLCPLLEEDLTAREQFALLTGSGIEGAELQQSIFAILNQATLDVIDSVYPSSLHMLIIPFGLAIIFAFITTGYLALVNLPSVACTVLKLRKGVIPTLRDPRFFKHRECPDLVAILTGSLFWGALGSGIVVGVAVGVVSFFFVWQATAYYAQRLLATAVGLGGITLIRILFLRRQRAKHFRSFYREQPGAANLLVLALEWAYFSLTAGFIVVRMVKLLLCAAVNVGRIDTPFLASGVGRIGNIELDHYHMVHMQDILLHEAHRHPYLEFLGVIYMMKMRHGESFGSRAGSSWRLIFVQALMPWLQKYRIQARPEMTERLEHGDTSLPGSFLSLSPPVEVPSVSSGSNFAQDPSASDDRVQQLQKEVNDLKHQLYCTKRDLLNERDARNNRFNEN